MLKITVTINIEKEKHENRYDGEQKSTYTFYVETTSKLVQCLGL